MLTFSKDFFQGETRDDFYIEPMMKCVWAAQLEVLAVVEQICRQNGLRYFADWGTLLGAVRHKGYIPWDDDLDICMLREDYNRFAAVAEKGLPGEYQAVSLNTFPDWDQVFLRVVNACTVSYDEERLRRFHGCPYMIGIDIFPLDVIPEQPQTENYHTELFSTVYSSARLYPKEPSEVEEILPDLEDLCGTSFNRSGNLQNQLLRAADAIAQNYASSGSRLLTHLADHAVKKHFLRKEWYEECVYLPFEGFRIPAPAEYDSVLQELFGDYMTPVRYAAGHDYPFYKKQQELYEQSLSASEIRPFLP